jgi:hypothetical protein
LPEPRHRQFHAEQEQQEYDAELGERLGARRVVEGDVLDPGKLPGELAEPVGPEREPDQQEAEPPLSCMENAIPEASLSR